MRERLESTLVAERLITPAPKPLERSVEPDNLLRVVVAKVAATGHNTATQAHRNPWGRPLVKPTHGQKGMAGVRADIWSGKVTDRELCLMSTAELAKRYKVKLAMARWIKKRLALYGIDGPFRDRTGRRRPLPPAGTPGPGQDK